MKTVLTLAAVIGSVSVAQAQRPDRGLPEVLVQFDTNEDGVLDVAESIAMREVLKERRTLTVSSRRYAKADTDGDGKVSLEERDAFLVTVKDAIEVRRAAKFADVAGEDGVLSLEEFSALPVFAHKPVERVESLFARLDADEDGSVTLEEFSLRLAYRPDRPTRPNSGGGTRPAWVAVWKNAADGGVLKGHPRQKNGTGKGDTETE